jgi:hypothetical protein
MTATQFDALSRTFPHGVCDYRRHSVGFIARTHTWRSFGDATAYRHPVSVPYPLVRSRVP